MSNAVVRTGFAALALCLCAGLAAAAVITVPGDQPTIQAGLNAARSGDTVLVMPGSYQENVSWPARDGIRLYSKDGPGATVIDGSGSGRVIAMSSSSILEATELRGFTVTGGFLSPEGNRNHGAGIYINGGFPVIAGNIIRGNACVSDTIVAWNYGGGVYISNSNRAGRRPEFRFNLIDSNVVDAGWGGWAYGAGIHVAGEGGAVFWQNVIRDNIARGSRPYAGGLYLTHSRTEEELDVSLLYSNLIIGNQGTQSGGVWAGGGGNRLHNNTIAGNSGAGVYLTNSGFAEEQVTVIRNNIIVGNTRGIFRVDNERLVADNSHNDVWNNSAGNYQNCAPGPGDISADPLFATGQLGRHYLGHTAAGQPATSPCVDAGGSLPELPMRLDTLVFRWTTRTDSVPDTPPVDIGYHYCLEGLPVGAAEPPARTPRVAALALSPNPLTNGRATLRYSLPGKGPARVSVFDVTGRELLRQSTTGNQQSTMPLDLRSLGAGVYLLKLEAEGSSATQKLVVQQ